MLKQNENLKFKHGNNNKKIFSKINIKLKTHKRLRRVLKKKSFFFNSTFIKTFNTKLLTTPIISIKISPNNVFCTLQKEKKTLFVASSGKYKIKTSKKSLKFSSKKIIQTFLYKIKRLVKYNMIIVNFTGPIRLKKKLIKQILFFFKTNSLIFNTDSKKCFNGCRPKKKKRKKQRGLRLFK
jgi:ribosomal protein S11